jgi:membrane protein YdbS with pleckstrin-like domain
VVHSLATVGKDTAHERAQASRRVLPSAAGRGKPSRFQKLPERTEIRAFRTPMGRYIDDILQPGEKVLYASNLHWIVYWKAILAWIVACTLLVLSRTTLTENLILFYLASAAVVSLAALYWSVRAWFQRWTTETDVTNLRVVHKTGFITRKTFEISVDKVASVEVEQGILGRMLNYGDVVIENMGNDNQKIETIASPLAFRSNITAR